MDANNNSAPSSLDQIEARLARIEQSLARVEQLAVQGEAMTAVASDIVDSRIAQHPELPEQLSNLLDLAQKLGTPQTANALSFAVEQLSAAPALVGTLADIVDNYAGQDQPGACMDNVVQNLQTLFAWLAKDSTKALLDAMPTDAESMHALSLLAQSASSAAKGSQSQIGLLGALSKLRSQDAGYALNFACELLQTLGRGLKQTKPALPQGS